MHYEGTFSRAKKPAKLPGIRTTRRPRDFVFDPATARKPVAFKSFSLRCFPAKVF
jgi:hypothetical protein